MVNGLASVLEFLESERAASGSIVYLVTGGDTDISEGSTAGELDIILDKYN